MTQTEKKLSFSAIIDTNTEKRESWQGKFISKIIVKQKLD